MIDFRYRKERLFKVLPQVFAVQPEGTVMATLIETMAMALAQLDADLIRTQRDHWLAFAKGDNDNSALERLAHLLGVTRLNNEATEDYRQRIALTAKIILQGLTTPRALLELAIVTLGAEPCPKQSVIKDTTLAFGLPLGSCKNCPSCKDAKARCSNAEQRVLELTLVENAPQQHEFKPSQPLKRGDYFSILSDSLTEDVPQILLQALDKDIHYPMLQNLATGEVTLFADVLKAGEVLSIWPEVKDEEDAQFDTYLDVDAHSWLNQSKSGSAVLTDVQGNARNVAPKVYYLNGEMFADDKIPEDTKTNVPRFADNQTREGARFADALSAGDGFDKVIFASDTDTTGAKFGGSSQIVRTPRILFGDNQWLFNTYNKKDIQAIAGEFSGDLIDDAPEQKTDVQAMLTLSWWLRPPATFHISIARNQWVVEAEKRGATQLFSTWLQQAKAAGVRATLDYPEPPIRENQQLQTVLNIDLQQALQESHELLDTAPVWQITHYQQEQQTLSENTALAWQITKHLQEQQTLSENAVLAWQITKQLQEQHALTERTFSKFEVFDQAGFDASYFEQRGDSNALVWQLTKELQEQQPLIESTFAGFGSFDQAQFDASYFK